MKKLICLAALAGAVLLAGCGRGVPVPPKNAAVPTFVVGMGCSDASCTDVSHHHDCPADCADYSHHHNCPLDCTDASHHHADAHHDFAPQVASSAVSAPALAVPTFVAGMGCADASCTDVSHHHDCPADCADYSHHHNCPLDCADALHHHADAHHDFAPRGASSAVSAPALAVPTFVTGMGCSDASCTDVSHHHDCPADCADYSHHHNCPLDCSDASHHHGGQSGTGAHHSEPGHHGGHH